MARSVSASASACTRAARSAASASACSSRAAATAADHSGSRTRASTSVGTGDTSRVGRFVRSHSLAASVLTRARSRKARTVTGLPSTLSAAKASASADVAAVMFLAAMVSTPL
ncbi:Uncharacterised protein [Mycobacteroides abscessus subsp. abscessus]|nr:Uncharacterised protein [Mycobacteroides abscessus subsp. abscessus]